MLLKPWILDKLLACASLVFLVISKLFYISHSKNLSTENDSLQNDRKQLEIDFNFWAKRKALLVEFLDCTAHSSSAAMMS